MIDYYPYLNMTRTQLVSALGKEPDSIGGTSRKYKIPSIYKYGNIEFVFEPYKNGKCVSIFDTVSHIEICGINHD